MKNETLEERKLRIKLAQEKENLIKEQIRSKAYELFEICFGDPKCNIGTIVLHRSNGVIFKYSKRVTVFVMLWISPWKINFILAKIAGASRSEVPAFFAVLEEAILGRYL